MSMKPEQRDESADRGPTPEEPFNPTMLIMIIGLIAAAIVIGLLID